MSTMREEIRQQPSAVERTLKAEWRAAENLRSHFERNPVRLVILVARGTSDNAAQFGRYLLEISTGIPVSLAAPSVCTLYHSQLKLDHVAVIAISQSGESTDTNLVLEQAKKAGAFTIGITNESNSTLARIAEHILLVRAGKEKSVAATKTYTGQLACLYLLAHALGASIRQQDLARIPDWCSEALKLEDEIRGRAERYCFMRHAVCVGRGLNYSNSFEFALKLMETCYVVAERFSSADLLHGPIAMLETSFPTFLFCPPGVTWKPMCELLEKLKNIGAETLLITDRSNRAISSSSELVQGILTIPATLPIKNQAPEDLYTPIPYIIPAQLFTASLAEVKHLDPDRPRTISKVTRTI
ncbi:MAG: SIS domain-containing protein [Acidobacteriaceae bacterium]|nr:SIS domain-containing protein [Acidobacteriaceae bacterium]MBV9781732.1 SIS domain-containing protein [Acidobacteriaceae bacterium]